MRLAARLSRPVSVHCVKAYGKIVDYLKDAGETKTVRSRGRGCGGIPDGGKGDNVAGLSRCHDRASGGHDGVGIGGSVGGGGAWMECETERSAGGERNVERDSGKNGHHKRLLLPPRIALQ